MGQQVQIQMPVMVPFGSVVFAPQALLGIDASQYTPGNAERVITAYLVGPHQIDMYGTDADAFKLWWDQVTGANRVVPAPAGLKLT